MMHDIPVPRLCAIAACDQPAVASCFECERFCCARHLSSVSVMAESRPVRVRVCPDCLHRYQNDPMLRPLLRPDPSRLV